MTSAATKTPTVKSTPDVIVVVAAMLVAVPLEVVVANATAPKYSEYAKSPEIRWVEM